MKKILLVEDNPSDVRLTIRAFKKSNISNELFIAEDGAEALEYLLGQDENNIYRHELPILVLLDIKLPKIDGLEVLSRIRKDERTELLPVVILTSSREQEDLVGGYKLGVNSYIRKPVDFNQFVDAVQQLGLYWLVLNESPFNK
jgi:two-component system response regulator